MGVGQAALTEVSMGHVQSSGSLGGHSPVPCSLRTACVVGEGMLSWPVLPNQHLKLHGV